MELQILEGLDLPMLVLQVGDGRWDEHTSAIRAFVADHLGRDLGGSGVGLPEPLPVA